MKALLQQFITEARDFLQSISEQLLLLEQNPQQPQLIVELFRLVHTLKGNSGLFDFSAMTQVLHAAEDLMDAVRDERLAFNPALADEILDAMDFVSHLIDEVAAGDYQNQQYLSAAGQHAQQLRQLLATTAVAAELPGQSTETVAAEPSQTPAAANLLADLPASLWQQLQQQVSQSTAALTVVRYQPEPECFFKGEDPFYLLQQVPGLCFGVAVPLSAQPVQPYDCYQSQLLYLALTSASHDELEQHFRCVREQVQFALLPAAAMNPAAQPHTAVAPAATELQLDAAVLDILQTQQQILQLSAGAPAKGVLAAVRQTLAALQPLLPALPLPAAGDSLSGQQLQDWLQAVLQLPVAVLPAPSVESAAVVSAAAPGGMMPSPEGPLAAEQTPEAGADARFGRRADDAMAGKVLKVEQSKIDRLMDLIGEIVVAKNGLPYLANKAEQHYQNREMAREIKTQYAVINRIVEEMQDAIMQVRMMPVSFIFQRFPRLVRDIARKLGKEVDLQISGEQTEADKTIIESLADPLIHILRNSLDHGLETADERRQSGKPAVGLLKIRASQESDRVLIVIEDDGRGINPAVIKRKAWEKQLINEEQLEKISDQDAIQLIFAAGFSTAAQVTDLSGRGVGMDVVKTAVQRVGGTVHLHSDVGKGTRLTLSLPLSMAVTNVMVIGADQQIFGIPMDLIVETVRLPISAVQCIKQHMTTVLRGRIIPLQSLNQLLGIDRPQILNEEQEYALMVVRSRGEVLGLLVDDFYEVIDIILKPLPGELGKMPLYAGSALLGDGSVLLVLNPQEF